MQQNSSKTRIAALINASAGTVEQQGGAEFRDQLQAAFDKSGVSASLEFVSGDELQAAAKRALKDALDKKIDAVAVGGGDGTVRCVASILAGTGVPLGVIPLGTLNHFAKDLNIPLGADEAAAVIAAGHSQLVDAGEVNGELFINNSSIGIYPFLVQDRERIQSEEGKQKWHAMLLAGFRTLRKFPLRRLAIRAEGETAAHRSPIVFVGNNEYGLSAGGFGKRERLNQGELAVYITKRETRISLFLLGLRAVFGRTRQSRDLRVLKSASVEIGSRTSRLPVALDGEVEILTPPLRYKIRKSALRVFVPKPKD